MLNQTKQTSGRTKSSVIEVDLKNAYDASEYANLESYLSKLNGLHGVHLDRTRGVAHLTYDPSVTTAEQVAADIMDVVTSVSAKVAGSRNANRVIHLLERETKQAQFQSEQNRSRPALRRTCSMEKPVMRWNRHDLATPPCRDEA